MAKFLQSLVMSAFVGTTCAQPVAGDADGAGEKPPKESGAVLPTVTVRAERPRDAALPPDTSTTVIDSAVIERKQSATIFDLVKDAPGVSVDGGPRSTGMKFNIRGFRGNDDVLFKIDGGVKGFEKYRFGGGVFIEPELIKSITIERGPSILTGSGAIGGAVIATTKSAADLLAPGERIGGITKLGYNANNHERLRMQAVFGRPTERSDLLVSWVQRDSIDFKLAGGQRFPASSTHLEGSLVKWTVLPTDDLTIEASRTAYRSGPTYTPFDTNSSNAFVGGYVHQSIADETLNLRFSYEPGLSWLKLRGTLAHETTDLDNLMLTGAGESTFTVPCAQTPCKWDALGPETGFMTDRWKYDIWTAEVFNESRYQLGSVGGLLTVGLQGLRNKRDLKRLTENPLMNGADGKYPGGFDSQQPPGTKTSLGVVAQNEFTWADWTFTPGIRRDEYRLVADGQAAIDRVALGEATSYRFTHTTRSATLTWRPNNGAWWFTHRWSEGFRPPLLTDHFGMGAASPCGSLTAGNQQIAPNGCGDRLVPTTAVNREYTVGWTPARWESGGRTNARLTLYRIDTKHLIGVDYLKVENDKIVQPFIEKRRGVEFEMSHEERRWYAALNFSRILARRTNTLDGSAENFTRGIPGPTVGISAGYRLFGEQLELGYRVRQIFDQMMLPGVKDLTTTTQYCGRVTPGGVVHAANTQQDVFAIWRAGRLLTVHLGIDNLFDKHWCNNGDELGNTIGLQGPGRSVKVAMTLQY